MCAERKMLNGIPVSAGMAMAKVYHFKPLNFDIRQEAISKEMIFEQLEKFQGALIQAKHELDILYQELLLEDVSKAKIFAAHKELLEDEEILAEVQIAIEEELLCTEAAIEKVFTMFADMLANVADPLIAGRAADLVDVKQRLIHICMGKETGGLNGFAEDVIVVAHDLLPSHTATMDRNHIKGIVTEVGGYNSHSAILARSFSIPAILGVSKACTQIAEEAFVLMDAKEGTLIISPDETDKEIFLTKKKLIDTDKEKKEAFRLKPCVLQDGRKVEIGLNIGHSSFETEEGLYDFIGLFRTEFLYMENDHLPDEDEQFVAYKEVVERANGRVVTLRTLDIGGDKILPYMELPKEENPFLGKRAIRLCFDQKDIFLTQLRAALRASAYGSLQIMFPMVGRLEDIQQAKDFVEQAKEQLKERGCAFDEHIRLGVMIEIPSLAMMADIVATQVDFASVGTNDLTQYMCAADRMNEEVNLYYESDSVAMYRILKFIFESFDRVGKPVSVCGEMAGDPGMAKMLVELGAKKLSMSGTSIAEVKACLMTNL